MKTDKIRAVGYIRVSTKEQAVEGYSLSAQREQINQYCAMYGLELVNIYSDEGISGKNLEDREGIQDLRDDAKEGLFDTVIIWKLSRISRKLLDTLTLIDELNAHKISLQSISEKIDLSTSTGTFMVQLMGSLNELERNTIRENVGLGHKVKATSGEWNGGRVIGYNNVKGTNGKNRLEVNEDEAKIIKYIYNTYLEGHGYRHIANNLNQQGYKTKRGNNFSTIAVKDILLNPLYKGQIRYGKKAKGIPGLKEQPITTQGQHEPIIDANTWDKVHARWKARSRKPAHNRLGSNVLTGLIKCPECNGHMVVSNSSYKLKSGKRVRKSYYVCGAFKNKGSTVCHANGIEVNSAEKKVAERFDELIDSDKLLEHLMLKMQTRSTESKDQLIEHRNFLTKKIVKSEERIHDYEDKMLEEPNLADVWELAILRLEAEKDELTSELLVTQNKLKTKNNTHELDLISKLITELIEKMKCTKTNRQLKELYLAFIDKIKWDKETLTFEIKLYFNEANIAEYLLNRPDPDDTFTSSSSKSNDDSSKALPNGRVFLHSPIVIWI